jgi:hemolysin activation/secretion protein
MRDPLAVMAVKINQLKRRVRGDRAITVTVVAVVSTLLASNLYAEPFIPDAGSILREHEVQLQRQQIPRNEAVKERPKILSGTGDRVTVKGFKFSGYEGLASESELRALLADSIDKSLTFMDLQAQTKRVTAYFKSKGWLLTRAYLPKQDVTSGIIQMVITQGKSDGQVTIVREQGVRVREETLKRIGEQAVSLGKPISEQSMEHAILLMNDLPGVVAKSTLIPGSLPGSSSVETLVKEGPLLSGMVWLDNYADHYSGTWRSNVMLSINDPFHYGDQITVLLGAAEGLKEGRVGYVFPIAYSGLKGNFSYTHMNYKLGGELAVSNYKGRIDAVDAGLQYPLLRSRITNVSTSATYGFKSLHDNMLGKDIRDRNLNSVTIAANGDHTDKFGGDGYTTWLMSVTAGNFHLSNADIKVTGTASTYSRFNLNMFRRQRLTDKTSLSLSLNSQKAFNNLDSSEKLYLGGSNGVRAYPVGEGAGDSGYIINTDIRYDIPLKSGWGNLQVGGFFDAGYITLNTDPTVVTLDSATNRNDYWLQGAGLGLGYKRSSRFTLNCMWAHVIGENPGRSIAGNNVDGHSDKSRYWLQSILFF